MKRWLSLALLFTALFFLWIAVTGCASEPVVVPVRANNTCHPATDLPGHIVIDPFPEADTPLGDFFSLFWGTRRDEGTIARDYNSLHDQCVDKAWPNGGTLHLKGTEQ